MNIAEITGSCRIVGTFLETRLDGADADGDLEAQATAGLVVQITPTVPVVQIEEPKFKLRLSPYRLTTNAAGQLVNSRDPDEPITVVPTDDFGHRYHVSITYPDGASIGGYVRAPRDGVVDLAELEAYLEPTPRNVLVWERFMWETRTARDEALDALSQLGDELQRAETAANNAAESAAQASAIAAGDIINDTTPSGLLVYSSQRVQDLLAGRAPAVHSHTAADVTSGVLNTARLPAASTAARGAVELATPAETAAGTDTTRAVTPSAMATVIRDRAMQVDPADYGVNVAGADATTAFRALVNTLPAGSEIRMRPGQTINLNDTIELPRPLTIDGGKILPAAGTGTLRIMSDRVRIRGVEFAGALTGTPVTGERFITTGSDAPNYYRGVEIVGNRMIGCNHSSIWVGGLIDFVIDDNTIDGAEYAGVMVISGAEGKIRGNNIKDLRQRGDLVNSYGIAITDTANTAAARSRHVLVDGNNVDGVPYWTGLDTHSGFDIKFTNNTVKNCRNAIAVSAGNDQRTTPPEACLVSGNYLEKGTAPIEVAAIVYTGKTGGGLPDRIATGVIGTNTIVGYLQDISYHTHDPERFVIAPQNFDGPRSGRKSPAMSPYRMYAVNVTVPVTNSASGSTVVTFPDGYFAPGVNPTVVATKSAASNAAFTAFEASATPTGVTIGVYKQDGVAVSGTVNIVVRVVAVQSGPAGQGIPAV